jgi:arylsulfatase A-like enzyme/Tfp pilus assembly protein PilF
VLVTLDTLRADHVGAYGGPVPTPALDRIAAAGVLVEDATAHAPLTRPSHVSLLTGLLPTRTGIRDNVSPAVLPRVPLLAERLRGAGFTTAGFVSSVVLDGGAGLARGFEVYDDDLGGDPEDPRFLDTAQRRGDLTLALATAWLETRRAAPRLFLWLHLYDPHDPYEPPPPYAERFAGRPYGGEVAWTDELVGRLDATLERLGLAANTLLVLTADHGEGLGDHGEELHGFFVYESTLRVPLLLRGPGVRPGTRLTGPWGLVDVLPTVLELLGLPVPADLDGRSLAAELAGAPPSPDRPLYAESLVPRLHFGWSELRAVRRGRYKYIEAPRPELYDLAADPGETTNLLPRHRRELHALRGALAELRRAEEAAAAELPGGTEALPPELAAQLAALGYLGGGSTGHGDPGADPKDKIGEFRRASDGMRRALLALHRGDAATSAALFGELLAAGIDSAELHLYRGRALLQLGRHREAAEHFRHAAERQSAFSGAWLGLAEALLQERQPEAALAALAAGRAALPTSAPLAREEGQLLHRLGHPERAREALAAAVRLDPADAQGRALLGEVLRDLGDVDGAIVELEKAVAMAPERAALWNALGMTLGGSGHLAEAERAFREAVGRDGGHSRYAFNLGLALLRQGREEEARPWLERSLVLDPAFAPAREELARLGAPGGH